MDATRPENYLTLSSRQLNARVENTPPSFPHLTMLYLNGSHVLLATAKVILYPHSGPPIPARALLDPGSQNCFICSHLAQQLDCKMYEQPLLVAGICNTSLNINRMTDIIFYSHFNDYDQFSTTCAVVDEITQFLPQVYVDVPALDIPSHLATSLADPSFGTPSQVDLLLGADIYYSLLKPGIHRLGKNAPTLIATHLGWLISGIVPPSCINVTKHLVFSHSFYVSSSKAPQEEYVDTLLERFWAQEELTTDKQMSEDDLKAETNFISSSKTLPNGRFQIDLPLIHSQAHKELGDSFVMAKHRFISLEKRLDKNPQMKEQYKNVLLEYLQLGHGKLIPVSLQTPQFDNTYFVPHLCVVKENSSSTKLRIVFDYSSKSSSQVSLNISLKGPKDQPELLDILVRFRNFKCPYCGH